MYYVYILRSLKFKNKTYVGYTALTPDKRLEYHNRGFSSYTRRFMPWRIIWFSRFETLKKAKDFEVYLKSGSGIAFRNKRLI